MAVAQLVAHVLAMHEAAGSNPVSHSQKCSGVWRNGIRAGLRYQCPQGREGSTPSMPTLVDSPSQAYGASLLMTLG